MNKTISINPDLFKPAGSKTARKRNEPKPDDEIKVRPQVKERRQQQNLRRNHVLRFIREQQDKNYKKLIAENQHVQSENKHENATTGFESDFEKSLQYLQSLEAANTKTHGATNHTMRNRMATNENVSLDFPSDVMNNEYNIPSQLIDQSAMQLAPPKYQSSPTWGCLKNGSLPTFRSWRNVTQRANPSGTSRIDVIDHNHEINQHMYNNSTPIMNASSSRIREIQAMTKQSENKNKPQMYYPKQKRVVRRTYKVGRSATQPVVSVLISNKTLRNITTTNSQLMKQTPIEDVRRYLVKHGFIKVGSSAPNEVLRKMHETAMLMCGEINNHNPDNLLYNFFHDVNSQNNN